MSFKCKILLDSVSETGKRITTFELTYPRIIHSEFMTHRMFSRNAASSRAIPAKKMRELVINETFIPEQFPKNIAGMQPAEWLEKDTVEYEIAKIAWKYAAANAVNSHKEFENLGIHKQIANRLLEPFLWYTCIVTATEFDNFFKLRTHPDAQYEIKRIADLMYEAYYECEQPEGNSNIQKLKVGEWHCPLVSLEDYAAINALLMFDNNYIRTIEQKGIEEIQQEIVKKISVARCARVSYLTHDGKRDIEKDLELFERLRTSGHWSPFEHVATPYFESGAYSNKSYLDTPVYMNLQSGNFLGWKQYRKEFQDENCINFKKENN